MIIPKKGRRTCRSTKGKQHLLNFSLTGMHLSTWFPQNRICNFSASTKMATYAFG